ncbi:MAG: hypothetical protein SNF68_01030 [Rikenellaceae bacterium]
MKKIFTILLLTILVSSLSLYAQGSGASSILKAHEREVKTSGKYYYGEGIDSDLSVARACALDDLKFMILERAMDSNEKLSKVDFKGFENDIETIIFELEGGRSKVLAYLTKENVEFEPSKGEQKVFVIRNLDNGVEIIPQGGDVVADVPSSAPAVQAPQQVATVATPAPTPTPVAPATRPQTQATPPSQVERSPNATTATRYAAAPSPGVTNPIIGQLMKSSQYEQARQILNTYKSSGKLMYGQLATISNPQNCYFLILRNREIIDILDKGPGNDRVSLKSGAMVNFRMSTDIVLWVNIL